VIERVTPSDAGRPVSLVLLTSRRGSSTCEIYEETPEIHKEAVREEVRVKKVVEQETVEAQETIRREELDVDAEVFRLWMVLSSCPITEFAYL